MRPSALCSTPAQAALYIRPGAKELRASPRVPAPRDRGRHGFHASERRARPAPAGEGQAGALRVRSALGGPQELPLRDQLLPDRDAVHPLRHRGRLSLSGRTAAQGVRRVRPGGDDRLRGPAPGRLRLRLAEGSPRVDVRRQRVGAGDLRIQKLRAQRMLRGEIEDEELEREVQDRLVFTTLEKAQNWARKNALWPLGYGTACCAIEMITTAAGPRADLSRFGAEVVRASPRQADMLILSGRLSVKWAQVARRLYDQMLEPKWVISMGACASSAGMFNNYALIAGADKFLPIDVYVPGCPPRPEALMYGVLKLQDKIANDPGLGWRKRYNAEGTEEKGGSNAGRDRAGADRPARPRAGGRGRGRRHDLPPRPGHDRGSADERARGPRLPPRPRRRALALPHERAWGRLPPRRAAAGGPLPAALH